MGPLSKFLFARCASLIPFFILFFITIYLYLFDDDTKKACREPPIEMNDWMPGNIAKTKGRIKAF